MKYEHGTEEKHFICYVFTADALTEEKSRLHLQRAKHNMGNSLETAAYV